MAQGSTQLLSQIHLGFLFERVRRCELFRFDLGGCFLSYYIQPNQHNFKSHTGRSLVQELSRLLSLKAHVAG
jgi:hypothetical protein